MTQSTGNRVLLALPAAERRAVLDACAARRLATGEVLARIGAPAPALHFPETAVISTLATYGDGATIEMANVGREACSGLGLILGRGMQLNTSQVQVGGAALELPAARVAELRDSLPAFRDALFAAVQAVLFQVMVSGACNGAHSARHRLARWLLTMQDRSDDETLPLTHEFLAGMLGVRRATVTEAAAELRREGTITYGRGQVRIADRRRLRAASCECYDRVLEAGDSLLPRCGG